MSNNPSLIPTLPNVAALASNGLLSVPSGEVYVADYGVGSGGGGFFSYSASSGATVNACTVFATADGGATRWLRSLNDRPLTSLMCGAYNDNSHNDTAALQALINATPSNGVAVVSPGGSGYKITSALTLANPIILQGPGATINQATAGDVGLSITSSNVTIDGLTLVGAQNSATNDAEIAISASGVMNAGSAPTLITHIALKNLTISHWGGFGIEASYLDQFDFQNLNISDIGYAGIGVVSGTNGTINNFLIQNIRTYGIVGTDNAYGIFLSRATPDSGDLTSQPRSANVTVSNGIVNNVPTWELYDTHGGQNITWANITGKTSYYGMQIGASEYHTGSYVYAPINNTLNGFDLDSGNTTGASGPGLYFSGVSGSSGAKATGSVSNGVLRGWGNQSIADGAIRIYSTLGLALSNIAVLYPSPNGLYAEGDNFGLVATGISGVDPWTNMAGQGQAVGFRVVGANNSYNFTGNSFQDDGNKSATYLLTTSTGEAMKLSSTAGNKAVIGPNISNAYTYLDDPNNLVRGTVTVSGATPVVVSNTQVRAGSQISLTPYPGQTGKGAFLSALVAGTSFSITSVAGDTSLYNYWIVP